MNPRTQTLALIAVLVATLFGFGLLYRLRLGQGDFFPAYSSLRSDPLGTRLLHDSLESLPGVRVTRWRQPIDRLPFAPARTIILAGLERKQWAEITPAEFAALDAAVRGGSRLVIALRSARIPVEDDTKNPRPTPVKSSPSVGAKVDEKKPESKARPVPVLRDRDLRANDTRENVPAFVDLAKLWGIELKERTLLGMARRAPLAPTELPPLLRWEGDVYFRPVPGMAWETIYRRGLDPVLLEFRLGLGSIVVAADSYLLSNEALQRDRSAPLLAWLMAAPPRVEFVESHLGITEDPGVAALARRYGLGGAFFSLLLLAGLFVWRRMALFVPAAEDPPDLVLDYNQTAGLEALLRRAVEPPELAATCVAEWRRTARAADIVRANEALAASPKGATPAAVYNAIARSLRRR